MGWMRATVAATAVCLAIAPGSVRADDELDRRNGALVAEGFSYTQGWTFGAAGEARSERLELVVPEAGERTLRFWAAATGGAIAFRLLGPDGAVLASWSGRTGELALSRELAPGKHLVEIERPAGVGGAALLGVKGGVLRRCEDPVRGRLEERAAAPARGFRWPYLLYTPPERRSTHLLVVPNNSGFVGEDVELLRIAGSCEIQRQTALADRLGATLLVPLFPRPAAPGEAENLYLHALTRASLEATSDAVRRVDQQLVAMIDDARGALDARVLLWGFSASGSFVSRFAILHPERVAAVACGSPGGWPIAPVADAGGDRLTYPVGIADVAELTGKPVDLEALRRVAWFLFLGAQDLNDAVPYRDSFSASDEALVMRRFGKTPPARWKAAEKLYARAGLDARFKLYRGAAHAVTPQMREDVAAFFAGR